MKQKPSYFAILLLLAIGFALGTSLLMSDESKGNNKPNFWRFLKKENIDDCSVFSHPQPSDNYPDSKNPHYNRAPRTNYLQRNASNTTRNEVIQEAGKVINQMERHLEEWGHASFSEVVLIPDDPALDERFGLDDKNPNFHYYEEMIRKSVQASAFLGRSLAVGGAAGVGVGTSASPPSAPLTFTDQQVKDLLPDATTVNNGDLHLQFTPRTVTENGASVTKGFDVNSSGLSLSESDIQKMAASTTVTGQVLNFMSNPIEISDIHQAYIGVTQVSVSPGLRTQKDYYCEVQVAVEYACEEPDGYKLSLTDGDALNSRKIPIPSVFAAFPLAQAQILESAFVGDDQFSFLLNAAADFSAAGQPAKANFLLKYAKKIRQEVANRTALPVVVPSSDGKSITYRFQPSLQALSDPTNKHSRPGWRLAPISIPAMIIVICEKDDLRDWDHISFTHSTRWVPIQKRTALQTLTVDWWANPFFADRRLSNKARLRNSSAIDHMICNYNWVLERSDYLSHEMRARVVNIRNLIRSHNSVKKLPLPKPIIDDITPSACQIDDLISGPGVTITGRNFSGIFARHEHNHTVEEPEVFFEGIPLRISQKSDTRIVAHLDKSDRETIMLERSPSKLTVSFPRGGTSENCSLSIVDAPYVASKSGIHGITPDTIRIGKSTTIVVKGFGFKNGNKDTVKQAIVAGFSLPVQTVNDDTLILTAEGIDSKGLETSPLLIVGDSGILDVYEGEVCVPDNYAPVHFDYGDSQDAAASETPSATKKENEDPPNETPKKEEAEETKEKGAIAPPPTPGDSGEKKGQIDSDKLRNARLLGSIFLNRTRDAVKTVQTIAEGESSPSQPFSPPIEAGSSF